MTSLTPREIYSRQELDRLYPKPLKLQLVQVVGFKVPLLIRYIAAISPISFPIRRWHEVLLRHGERAPVSARFQNAGLAPYWPYCNAAKELTSATMTSSDWSQWSTLHWRRRLETFGFNDSSVLASGPSDEVDGVCNLGELTNKGRETTLALGQRLRHLYVDQLKYLPAIISDADMIYLRATPMPRALESVQQAFWGLYPLTARTASFPRPIIYTRTTQDETLYPNDANCPRLRQLTAAFADRCAEHWNDSPEMSYLTKKLGKWMPGNQPVRVDSHPRLSGIMDTINSTLAHGPRTRLPRPFYDVQLRDIIDKIGVEESFAGYVESNEYRTLGIGPLAGDIVARMVGSVEQDGNDGLLEVGGDDHYLGKGRSRQKGLMFGLSGCHDTTLAALLSALGGFDNERWPPYTSHIAFELLRDTTRGEGAVEGGGLGRHPTATKAKQQNETQKGTSLMSWLGLSGKPQRVDSEGLARRSLSSLTPSEKSKFDGFFVRVRYNDRVITVPGCKPQGRHWQGDESLCTLEAFKGVVDRFTPTVWKDECQRNLDQPAMKPIKEPAGSLDSVD